MKCHTTPNTLQINHKQRIGNVVVFVEGENDEYELLNQIFCKILSYGVFKLPKNKSHISAIGFKAPNQRGNIYVFNLASSNIRSVRYSQEYRDDLYRTIRTTYNLDLKNQPIYYLWDRDNKSNQAGWFMDLFGSLCSAYGNEMSSENGLLLINYPSIEAYNISNFTQIETLPIGIHQKTYVKEHNYKTRLLDESTLLCAAYTLHYQLRILGITEYEPSDFYNTNSTIFKTEEEFYSSNNTYRLLSLLSIILIDLGIITEVQTIICYN